MTYHHLTYHDRIQIGALLQVQVSPTEIAKKLARPKSTIYRELARNSCSDFYFYSTAQILSENRKSNASLDRCEDEEIDEMIAEGLRHGMSPAQISGRLKAEGAASASTSMIYARVKKDKLEGGDLWMNLRRSQKTYRRSFSKGGNFENGIINRVSIEERADIVEYRERSGDLEGDTIIGAKRRGVLLTMNDRVTKKVAINKLKNKKADHVCEEMIQATSKFVGKKHTCTLDNGTEFAGHEDFTEATGVKVFFCHPRTPEERGSNENMNGLIRQYIPKGTDISKIGKVRIKFIEYSLNSRPRQQLNFLTPLEAESRGKVKFHFFS
jgi:IS30 family transposase